MRAATAPALLMKLRGRVGNLLILAGAAGLLASLFLTWSHQFSPALLSQLAGSPLLRDVPHDPDAWQVYSVVDVALAALASALVLVAALGGWRARLGVLAASAPALAFTLHALAVPPTNGADISGVAAGARNVPNSPGAGVGETVALAALAVAITGLAVSLSRVALRVR